MLLCSSVAPSEKEIERKKERKKERKRERERKRLREFVVDVSRVMVMDRDG